MILGCPVPQSCPPGSFSSTEADVYSRESERRLMSPSYVKAGVVFHRGFVLAGLWFDPCIVLGSRDPRRRCVFCPCSKLFIFYFLVFEVSR